MVLANLRQNTERQRANDKIEELQASVYHYCLSLTRSKWDAEDLAQDTWLKGMRAAIDSPHQNPEALLLRIAKNTWIDQMRRRNHYERIMMQMIQHETAPEANSLGIEETFYALMNHLSPLQRTVFLLREALDYSIAETAELLNTTAGAIKAALHRARDAMGEVRRDLESQSLIDAVEEDKAALIRAMAIAYQAGDLALLIELAQRDGSEPAVISGIVQNRRLQTASRVSHSRVTSIQGHAMQMAA